jgi:hypothetical protein
VLITKNQIVVDLESQIKSKVFLLKKDIDSLVKDSSENSKPTSGDKHEVGLEMAMGELDRMSAQLDMYKRQLSEIELTDFSEKTVVEKGALVKTDRGMFLIAVAFGQIKLEKAIVFCLSLQSPLAQALLGSSVGDLVRINGLEHRILAIS